MALDFPANPTDGQIFNSYIWSAAKGAWQSREEQAPVAIISAVAPLAANDGDIWYNSSRGVTYVYYNDGTSSQWVEVVTSGTPELATKADLSYVNTQLALKSNISGQNFSGKIGIIGPGSQTTVGASNGTGGLEVQSTSSYAASMSFHIPGIIATNVGLNRTDSKFSIGGWSFPVDSFTIDQSGRVNIPNQPSFTATRNDDGNNRAAGDYVFDKVWHNTGGYYSSSNGRFTAPVAGRYLFISQFQLWGTAGGALGNSYFRKNGSQYPSASSSEGVQGMLNKPGDSGYHANLAVTAIIDLAANDYVTVYQSGVRGMQSHFSGHLLG